VMYFYQVIVSKKMFLNNFFEKLSWYRHHVKVFTIHYVNGINWRKHFLKWIRTRFRIGSGLSLEMDPDPVQTRPDPQHWYQVYWYSTYSTERRAWGGCFFFGKLINNCEKES
jgi:hypothetical protein